MYYKITQQIYIQNRKRIEKFEDCHYVYKILQQKTESFDPKFANNVAKQYKLMNSKLNQSNNNNSNQSTPKKRRRMNAKVARLQMMQSLNDQTKKGAYNETRNKLFSLLYQFIEFSIYPYINKSYNSDLF